jgi:polysaccharide biosynthesis/export protein
MQLPQPSHFVEDRRNPKRKQGWHVHTRALGTLAACLLASLTGCHAIDLYTPSLEAPVPPELEPPRELSKVSLPTYRIEPPDAVRLEVMKLVPRASYRIDAQDVVEIHAIGVIVQLPIDGYFLVENDGVVTLGPGYGVVRIQGMTAAEATAAITRYLRTFLPTCLVTVRLARSASAQDISREYLVGPDGVIQLSRFGAVNLNGKTVTEARLAIQDHLAQYFDSPVVGVTVIAYNSKFYYVIAAGLMSSEDIQRFPISGNETVLDALEKSQLKPNTRLSSKTMWLARPAPGDCGEDQVLPVDWEAIAAGGETKTNYQILPGDRLYIVDDNLVAMNEYLTVFTRPIDRLLNLSQLGITTTRGAQTMGRSYNFHRNTF